MQCQQCGTALSEGAQFCSTCGLRQPAPYPPQQPYSPGQPVAPTQPLPVPTPPAQQRPPQQPPAQPPAAPYAQPGYAQQPPYQQQPATQQSYQAQTAYQQQSYQQAATPAPAKRKRTGMVVGIVAGVLALLVAVVAVVVLILMPASSIATQAPPGAYMPVRLPASPDTTSTSSGSDGIDTADNTAAEDAVVLFYATINSGEYAAVTALTTADTRSALDPGAFEGWAKTTFEIARSVVDGDTAYVYGRESVRQFGSEDKGVKFTLLREGGSWLIKTWQPVDEGTVNGAMPTSGIGSGAASLTDSTARDVVSSLLQARQVGDAKTIRMLTSLRFQQDNAAVWLDGVDNTPYFTAFAIKSSKKSGAGYVLTVTERWNSGTETGTYTVIDDGGSIVVDTWSSK